VKITPSVPVEDFLREMLYIAWKGCEHTTGMGYLQDKPDASKVEVRKACESGTRQVYADYIFGRMLKLRVILHEVNGNLVSLEMYDETYQPAYQSFAHIYPTTNDLIHSTKEALNCTVQITK